MRDAEYFLNHPIMSLDDIRKMLDMQEVCSLKDKPRNKRSIFYNCPNCGAIILSNVCEYCGTSSFKEDLI